MYTYNVAYENLYGETRLYCSHNMSKEEAINQLHNFKQRYFTKNGLPKGFPNGEGTYDFINPRIVNLEGVLL